MGAYLPRRSGEVYITGRLGSTDLPQKSVQHPHTNQPICMRGACPGAPTYLEEGSNGGTITDLLRERNATLPRARYQQKAIDKGEFLERKLGGSLTPAIYICIGFLKIYSAELSDGN
jgi:hypothetical protein